MSSSNNLIKTSFKNWKTSTLYSKSLHYNRSETYLIKHSIKNFDWSKSFSGKNVHEQVEPFNKTLLNIFHNFIPNKFVACDD